MSDFDLRSFVPYLLNQAAEETSLEFARRYRERYNMLRTEWRVLFHLGRYGDLTASEIGRISKMHKTKISRAVKALQEKRFIEARKNDADKRSDILALLPAGRRAYNDLATVAERYNNALLSQFSAGERLILLDCLERLAQMESP
ncbi:MarR family winged helix-turn-helix transcriptional regulator [Sulfitobacter sp. HNIBRBA3233]|uniref:MarR family winged helix-turn-helix transcriptional regulator n=1 Tax=Sulfitobacter marinivivus TaxID=3158558 RepID=UPI0032DEB670